MTEIPLVHFLVVSAFLFGTGFAVAVTKRSLIGVLLGIELMLNAANLNMVAFSRYDTGLQGQMFALFIIVVAAAEAAVALAIILRVYSQFQSVDPTDLKQLKN